MPRRRFILIIWITGMVLLLGAWAHSLLRDSSILWASSSGVHSLEVGLYLGTFSVQGGECPMCSAPGLQVESVGYKAKSAPGDRNALEKIDYFVGPLGEFDCYDDEMNWFVALPLWFLLLLLTALCLPFYLHARRSGKALHPPIES